MKTFKYRTSKYGPKPKAGVGMPQLAKSAELLTGMFLGQKATDNEERWGKASERNANVMQTFFQFQIGAAGTPGYRTLDFLHLTVFGWKAIEIDGMEYVHKGEAKAAADRLADLQRLAGLKRLGINVREIIHVTDNYLQSQPDADRKAKEIL